MKEFVKVQDITKTYKMGEVEIHARDGPERSICRDIGSEGA